MMIIMKYIGTAVFLLILFNVAISSEISKGGCSCAVLSEKVLCEPIIVHALPLNVTCDEEGSGTCLQLCVALAQGARERAPALICEKLNVHVENLTILLYTRVCDAEDWTYTGLKGSEPICCHEGKAETCAIATVSHE